MTANKYGEVSTFVDGNISSKVIILQLHNSRICFYKPSNYTSNGQNLMAWYLNKTVKKKNKPKTDVAVLSYMTPVLLQQQRTNIGQIDRDQQGEKQIECHVGERVQPYISTEGTCFSGSC